MACGKMPHCVPGTGVKPVSGAVHWFISLALDENYIFIQNWLGVCPTHPYSLIF